MWREREKERESEKEIEREIERERERGSFHNQYLSCRFAKYHTIDGVDSRDLVKAYGILFKIEVIGTVSK